MTLLIEDPPRFLVDSVSRAYLHGAQQPGQESITQLFSRLVCGYLELGYVVRTFNLETATMPDGQITETIVAVFERSGQ